MCWTVVILRASLRLAFVECVFIVTVYDEKVG